MGRTKRHRSRKNSSSLRQHSIDDDPKIIALKKWLSQTGWKNHSKLILTNFPLSGRGLSSQINIKPKDKLISIPYEAMITYVSFETTEVYDVLKVFPKKLDVAEVFTMFLCLEKHKKELSAWKMYLDTLPEAPLMPWRCQKEELSFIPEDVFKLIRKYIGHLEYGYENVKSLLIQRTFQCNCCGIHLHEIIRRESFYDNYILFMTRCLYLDHLQVKRFTKTNIENLFSDEPNVLLCPLLDMFNHSTNADAELCFEQEENKYFLNVITQCSFPKNTELYFSYGKHDNLKLFCYYGFYLPINNLDYFEISKKDIESLSDSKEKLEFVQEKRLDENLIWHVTEPSCNLTLIAYIISTKDDDWKIKVFSQNFNQIDLNNISNTLRLLLLRRINRLKVHIGSMKIILNPSKSLNSIIDFCEHRLSVLQNMLLLLT